MAARDPGEREGRIQSVDRAAALLAAVADAAPEPAPVALLAARTGINRTTAWRLLATLEDNALVERRDAGYVLGAALARLAEAASRDALERAAHPVLARVATVSGETASLAVARRSGLLYVDAAAAAEAVSEDWLGRHVPLHATSAGKAFLAALPPAEVDALLPARLPAFTGTTITSREALDEELAATRARGFAVCLGELDARWQGVAAAVVGPGGRPLACVDLWGAVARVPAARFAALGELVREAAAEIATRAGLTAGGGDLG